MMKKICFINSYNYEEYLTACIESAENQTLPFDQIIIVDDGSTDLSTEIIKRYAGKTNSNIIPVYKKNEGQLSALNAAVEHISTLDQVFILDCDDIYPPDYLELMIKNMGNDPWDISFAAQIPFQKSIGAVTAVYSDNLNFVFHNTSAIVRARKMWIGNPSSTISISGALFRKIFPYPNVEDFVTRADDVMVYTSSILGAKKTFIRSIGTCWRIHESNNTHKISEENWNDRQERLNRLFEFYCKKYSIPLNPTQLEYLDECQKLDPICKAFLNSLLGPNQELFE